MSLRYRVKSWKMASLITLCLASLFNVTSSSCGHVIEADFFFFSFSRAHKTENKKPTTKFVRWQMRKQEKRQCFVCFFFEEWSREINIHLLSLMCVFMCDVF